MDTSTLTNTIWSKPCRAASVRGRSTSQVAIFTAQGQRVYRGRIDDWYVAYGKPRASPTTAEFVEGVEAVLAGRAPATAETTAVGCPIPPLPGEARP